MLRALMATALLLTTVWGQAAEPGKTGEADLWALQSDAKVPIETKLDALEELEKSYYAGATWDRFFAIAVFYRAHGMPFREGMYGRELLALGKLCRWDDVSRVFGEYRDRAGKQRSPLLEEIHNHLLVQRRFQSDFESKERNVEAGFVFQKTAKWKIRNERIRSVATAEPLRVSVGSECP